MTRTKFIFAPFMALLGILLTPFRSLHGSQEVSKWPKGLKYFSYFGTAALPWLGWLEDAKTGRMIAYVHQEAGIVWDWKNWTGPDFDPNKGLYDSWQGPLTPLTPDEVRRYFPSYSFFE